MFSLACLLILAGLAVTASVVDARTFRLPNILTAAIFGVGLLCLFGWNEVSAPMNGGRAAVLWIALLAGQFCVALLPSRPIGMGDVKLMAGLGLPHMWWGTSLLWLAIAYFSATLFAIAHHFGSKSRRIAFGPHLTGGWIVVVVGQLACVAMAYSR